MKISVEELYSIYKSHPKICTDTRKIIPNSIFFALKGENFNANEFAEKALKGGCSYAVIDEKKFEKDNRYLLVENVLASLQHLATHHRSHLKIPFIAITGTNGKTTTKELIKEVLSKKFKTLATIGNLNNHIGVPLTVLSITDETEIAVIEMGANHIGEIAKLCEIAKPDFGIITNIGKAHLEGFGSFEGVIKAKTELYQFIKSSGMKVFVNADDELLLRLSKDIESITYGTSPEAGCRGEIIKKNSFVKIKFTGQTISSHLVGKYNAENILCTVALGNYFGIEKEKIKEAIESYMPSNNRSQVLKKKSNTIIVDCYNANPSSMEAAIKNSNADIAILGDMFELGSFSNEEHERIFRLAENKFRKLILVGPEFSAVAEEKNQSFKTTGEALEWLKKNPVKNCIVFLKGSRGMQLEKLLDVL